MSYNYDNYNWIDDNIAIGDRNSDYSNFNIIVNLDYNNNQVQHHHIDMKCLNGQHIYRVGCYDSEQENIGEMINIIVPELIQYYKKNPNLKILFHCAAGISRSSTMAISFLCMAKYYPLSKAYILAKQKRPIINPNKGFMNYLIRMFS